MFKSFAFLQTTHDNNNKRGSLSVFLDLGVCTDNTKATCIHSIRITVEGTEYTLDPKTPKTVKKGSVFHKLPLFDNKVNIKQSTSIIWDIRGNDFDLQYDMRARVYLRLEPEFESSVRIIILL